MILSFCKHISVNIHKVMVRFPITFIYIFNFCKSIFKNTVLCHFDSMCFIMFNM